MKALSVPMSFDGKLLFLIITVLASHEYVACHGLPDRLRLSQAAPVRVKGGLNTEDTGIGKVKPGEPDLTENHFLYIHCISFASRKDVTFFKGERPMAKLSKKAKSLKKEIKARKAKVNKHQGKLKKLKKAFKKAS